jgi:hypothetical protein
METPWVELTDAHHEQAYGGQFAETLPWHALFALQVCVRPFPERLKFRWGFNNEALLAEALDRQKMFIETLYAINHQYRIELPERPTVVLRGINRPGEGLVVSLVAKTCAQSPREARQAAHDFCRQLAALVPYDHAVYPAATPEMYQRLAGIDILNNDGVPESLAQLKRFETPLPAPPHTESVLGLWQAAPRSNEQIWRVLASLPMPALINISLRPTVLYEQERKQLMNLKTKLAKMDSELGGSKKGLRHKNWVEPLINRRLSAWGKFFYMQIHLAAAPGHGIDDSFCRAVGTALTRDTNEQPLPGFEFDHAVDEKQAAAWRKMLTDLEIIQSGSEFYIPRLHDIVDLDEAWAVFRFPYPPEGDWPDVKLQSHKPLSETA